MPVPATIRAGDTIEWIEPAAVDLSGNAATSATWAFISYLRHDATHEGATITGTAEGSGWKMSISATTSAGFDVGLWSWQSRISAAGTVITVGSGTFQTLPNLSYTGQPAAYDGRTQAEKDLEAVQTAIRALIAKGAKSYSIGSRSYTSNDLGELIKRESQLKAVVARERAAEKVAQGLGDPRNLFVRFG